MLTTGISVRLLCLLLVAEIPLVVFVVVVTLQNDRLRAGGAVSHTLAEQTGTLRRLGAELHGASSIAGAASALPPSVLTDPRTCGQVLTSLMNASDQRVASIAVTDAAGSPLCTAPAGLVVPSLPAAAETTPRILHLDGRISVIRSAPGVTATRAVVTLPPLSSTSASVSAHLWLGLADNWIDLTPAPASVLPGQSGPKTAPAHWRAASAAGMSFLYSTVPLPAEFALPAGRLLAGSDVRRAARDANRTFMLRLIELAGSFVAESLLIAAGVNLVASRPLRRLEAAVETWRTRGRFTDVTAAVAPAEVRALAQSFAQASRSLDQRERELHNSIAQQELLMQEIHHRVKNNLQIIASLLNLQAARIKGPEARAEFQSARDRVRALATLHRHLYAHGDLHLIDMRAFFAELCSQLFRALDETEGDRIAIAIAAPDVNISSDQAVPIALIVTETVGNAIKYAFPADRRGSIQITFEVSDESCATLMVRDDGVGLSHRPDGDRVEGLGLQLVRGFARQLGARLTISSESGTCYRLDMAIERQRKNMIALGTAPAAPPPR